MMANDNHNSNHRLVNDTDKSDISKTPVTALFLLLFVNVIFTSLKRERKSIKIK